MQTIQNQLRTTAALIMALVMFCSCGNAGKKIMQKAQQKSVEKELADLKKQLPMVVEGTNILITDIELEDDIVAYTVEVESEVWKSFGFDQEVANSDRNYARTLANIPDDAITRFISIGLGLKYIYTSAETHKVLGELSMSPEKLKDVWDRVKSGELKAFTLIELSQMELDQMEFPVKTGEGVSITDAYIKGHNLYYIISLDSEIDPEYITSDALVDLKHDCVEGLKKEQTIMLRKKEMFDENIHFIYIYKDSRGKEVANIDISASDLF